MGRGESVRSRGGEEGQEGRRQPLWQGEAGRVLGTELKHKQVSGLNCPGIPICFMATFINSQLSCFVKADWFQILKN